MQTRITENPMRIYFDQNILGLLAGANLDALQSLKRDGLSYVYSRTNIEEISKCDNSDQYLALLKGLDAQYLELIMDDGKFTDEAQFFPHNPVEVYDNHVSSMNSDYGMSSILGRLAFKLTGGKTTESFDELSDDLAKASDSLSDEIRSNISESFVDKIMDFSPDDVNSAMGVFKIHMAGIEKDIRLNLSEHIQDEEKYEGVMDVRRFYGSDKSGFSDIEPPHVMEKIWERVQKTKRLENYNITREQFLGLVPYGDNNKAEFKIPDKIFACYGMLNWVGYWPDEKIRTESGFASSFKDAEHAVYAAYCEKFYSADKRLVMKMRAIYEHLNFGTQVVLCNFVFTE